MATQSFDTFIINVPHFETKRFKAIVKAFGFDFQVRPQTPLEKSIAEEKAGKVYSYSSIEDLIKEFE